MALRERSRAGRRRSIRRRITLIDRHGTEERDGIRSRRGLRGENGPGRKRSGIRRRKLP